MNPIHLASVDLNLLVLFDVVRREGHVGRAGQRLGLSASAVSHGLGRLRRLFADPLFLRTPKGVVATDRATLLAPNVTEILERVQAVVATATPFQAATSKRRFVLGMPDATAVVLLPALLAQTRRSAPLVDLSFRHIFPASAPGELEARLIDLALVATDELPARFVFKPVYEEEFVVAARKGHPFLKAPTLNSYCDALHVLASTSGDAHGFVDEALAEMGLARRVAVVVSNFMLALAALEHTDLITAVPRGLVQTHGARFGLGWVPALWTMTRPSTLHVVATRAAMQDAGIAWLFETLVDVARCLPERPGSAHAAAAPSRRAKAAPSRAVPTKKRER
jgi:DNA-binding transcriptional LysR family regulator